MKKHIILIATALLVASASFLNVGCTEEFQVEPSQIYGKWYFPLNLAPDTVTGFDFAGDMMLIKAPDSLWVEDRGMGKNDVFLWTLRDNNVTATAKSPVVGEYWVLAFTVHNVTSSTMEIVGKYRYIYDGDNTERGDISCTMTRKDPHPQAKAR